ncbi:hypothetical protein M8J77_015772 [Diaphorina citri]|nr:hypothetical protein M8J77_015772 [Diaphorina citri]
MIVEKIPPFQKYAQSYVQEKDKILIKLSKSLKVLQNQIDHYDYVRNTQPSKDFLKKFENVQKIVMEKINKRIESEMKEFVDLKNQYVNLFSDLKYSIQNFIRELKAEANLLDNFQQSIEDSSFTISNEQIEKSENKPNKKNGRSSSKRKSSTDKTIIEKPPDGCMSLDGIYVVIDILSEVIVLENMNIIKLISVSTYDTIKVFCMDDFRKVDTKLNTVHHLLKCFYDATGVLTPR